MKNEIKEKIELAKEEAKKASKALSDHVERFKDVDYDSLREPFDRAIDLFGNTRLRNWIFGPFFKIFYPQSVDLQERKILNSITGVSLANAVMCAIPGPMGVSGVAVAMALEAYLALRIAQHLGIIKYQTLEDIGGLLSAVTLATLTVGWGFKICLNVVFSIVAMVGILPASFIAQLIVTNFFGVFIWTGFREVLRDKPFRVPLKSGMFMYNRTKLLVGHQWNIIESSFSMDNISHVGNRCKSWINGEMVLCKRIQDRVYVAAFMAHLITNRFETLDGPIGKLFIQSIRDLYPDLAEASIPEMAEHFRGYTEDQMAGVLSQIKGTLHEHMVVAAENTDGDDWIAFRHADPYHPSTDVIYVNTDTDEMFEVSLKATDNTQYVEHALLRYPDDVILVTQEVAEKFDDDSGVSTSGFNNYDIEEITADNFDLLLLDLDHQLMESAATATLLAAAVTLWPFVAAFKRDAISKEQLETACVKVFGEAGKKLVARLVATAVFGPVYMWYVLAKFVMDLVEDKSG